MQIEKKNSNKTKIYNKHANKKSKTQIKKKNESNQKKAKGRSSGKPPRLVFSIQIQMVDTDADAIQMLARLARIRLLRHALPISLLILRKTRLFCSLRTEVRRLTEHYFHRGFQN